MQPEQSATRSKVDALYRKVFWRTIPILIVSYIIAFIDRGNVGFAKLQVVACFISVTASSRFRATSFLQRPALD
jgi:sugar phosphate permease